MELNLGVIDIPYVDNVPEPKVSQVVKARAKRRGKGGRAQKPPPRVFVKTSARNVTTGQVAQWLEDKYHVYEIFFNTHEDEIVTIITEAMEGTLEDLFTGAPARANPLSTAEDKIAVLFKQFIDMKEMDGLGYPGVPTLASIIGIRSRFKERLDPGRPSFQDSSLYEDSFRAWVE